jgi:hypothetical protein
MVTSTAFWKAKQQLQNELKRNEGGLMFVVFPPPEFSSKGLVPVFLKLFQRKDKRGLELSAQEHPFASAPE